MNSKAEIDTTMEYLYQAVRQASDEDELERVKGEIQAELLKLATAGKIVSAARHRNYAGSMIEQKRSALRMRASA